MSTERPSRSQPSDRPRTRGKTKPTTSDRSPARAQPSVAPSLPSSSSSFSTSTSTASSSASALEDVKRSLSSMPEQVGYLITDHHGTALSSSGDLATTSLPTSLFHRLFFDTRGLLDHSASRASKGDALHSIHRTHTAQRHTLVQCGQCTEHSLTFSLALFPAVCSVVRQSPLRALDDPALPHHCQALFRAFRRSQRPSCRVAHRMCAGIRIEAVIAVSRDATMRGRFI